jgi:HWE histidine kinase
LHASAAVNASAITKRFAARWKPRRDLRHRLACYKSKGQLTGASKIARDITERKRFEETQALLLREMHHRVKNLFAVASSIVALSAPEAATPAALAQIVQHRLLALARAHELTLTNPASVALAGTRPAGLHSLTKRILLPFQVRKEGWSASPPRGLILRPAPARSLELPCSCTNWQSTPPNMVRYRYQQAVSQSGAGKRASGSS